LSEIKKYYRENKKHFRLSIGEILKKRNDVCSRCMKNRKANKYLLGERIWCVHNMHESVIYEIKFDELAYPNTAPYDAKGIMEVIIIS